MRAVSEVAGALRRGCGLRGPPAGRWAGLRRPEEGAFRALLGLLRARAGTTGTCALHAIRPTPGLGGCSSPVSERVPSGNTMTTLSWESVWSTRLIASMLIPDRKSTRL